MKAALRLIASLGLTALACSDSPSTGTPTSTDASTVADAAAQDTGVPDAGEPVALDCRCEVDESCSDCMALIGECCYGDPGLPSRDGREPMAEAFARRCEADPQCRACCNECTTLTCDQLFETFTCPPPPRPNDGNANRLRILTTLPLTEAALSSSVAVDAYQLDLAVFAFAVECALSEDQSVNIQLDGQLLTLPGKDGFAPEWADGPCDEACQRWVTACMGARTNNWNVVARIFVRTADHDDREVGRDGDTAGPVSDGLVQEGAFYGNAFADPPRLYACRGEGRDPFYDVVRICSHLDNSCGIIPVGPCRPGPSEDDARPHACERVDETGALRGCHSRLSRPDGTFPEGTERYDETSTLYIPATAFASGTEAGGMCEQLPAPGEHPLRPIPDRPGAVGDPCVNDDDCNAPDLICRVLGGPGICIKGCAQGTPAEETLACGSGNTCLQHNDGNDYCVQACRSVRAGGEGCPAGRVCTSYAILGGEDTPGCANFCHDDDDCLATQFCGRDGICQLESYAGDLDDRTPDGYPCRLDAPARCRGLCVPVDGDRGICGSFIDRGKRFRCPDDPFEVPPLLLSTEDDLAVCLFRRCQSSEDCVAPLECIGEGAEARCTYDL